MEITFQPTTDADVARLLPVYNHYVRTDTATFHTQEIDEATFRDLLFPGYPRYDSWTIQADGVLAGYVILARYKPREAYDGSAEVTIYLDPTYPNKGLGTAAVTFVEGVAVERQFHNLLAIICGENTASIRLFEKLGYQKCAHYHQVGKKFGRWLDIVSYEKLLPSR
jgi:L-amino acid N-acyltransferase YncA